ncbi:nucleotidyltransferase, partial [Ornithobacterium rhinotracheale]|nr:nucleotidyltransferase [Ornithobacterium rhinotracheale]MRJ11709.1 nucleotidyltransferase [Ornithobacterium rhinotracheale]
VLEHLTDHLQKLKGVAIPHLQQVRSKWLDGEYTAIAVRKVPESGYFKVDETELNITYEPNI